MKRTPTQVLYWLAPAYGLISFLCSRGPDGQLFIAMECFAVLAVVYAAFTLFGSRRIHSVHLFLHLFLYEVLAIAVFCIPPRLEEMAVMLYYLIPLMIAGGPALGAIATLGRWIFRAELVPEECAKCGYDLTGNKSGVCPECGRSAEFIDCSAPPR